MTEFRPKPIDVTVMWTLACCDGDFLSGLPNACQSAATRRRLRDADMLVESTKLREATGRKCTFLELSDQGWLWLGQHLDVEASDRSPATAKLFNQLTRRLGLYLRKNQDSLADFMMIEQTRFDALTDHAGFASVDSSLRREQGGLCEQGAAGEKGTTSSDLDSLEHEIATAYTSLAGNQSNARVRLADLRSRLSTFSPEQIDAALWQMSDAGRVVLNRLDNPLEISDLDRQAAVFTPGLRDPRHIMHMEIHSHVQN